MKAAVLLLLFLATSALAQTPPQTPANPGSGFQDSPRELPKPRHFRVPWKSLPLPRTFVPLPPRLFDANRLDPSIVRRPPQDAFTPHPSRTPLNHNLYPDLKVLPVELAQVEPAPIAWPNLKLDPIPITWPNLKETPAEIPAPASDTSPPE